MSVQKIGDFVHFSDLPEFFKDFLLYSVFGQGILPRWREVLIALDVCESVDRRFDLKTFDTKKNKFDRGNFPDGKTFPIGKNSKQSFRITGGFEVSQES